MIPVLVACGLVLCVGLSLFVLLLWIRLDELAFEQREAHALVKKLLDRLALRADATRNPPLPLPGAYGLEDLQLHSIELLWDELQRKTGIAIMHNDTLTELRRKGAAK
jgi:hypothetical protein